MQFRIVAHGSDDYDRSLSLRLRNLREPLGLDFSAEEIAAESAQTHLAAFDETTPDPVACLVLVDTDPASIQIRQMAVAENTRRRGLGSAIIRFAEEHARTLGKDHIFCHSRYYVVPFYEKLGYTVTGVPFKEVGLTHVRMEKDLI